MGGPLTSNPRLREVTFTADLTKLRPVYFDLVTATLGSKNREVLFRFIMKDSYFKIRTELAGVTFRVEAREVEERIGANIKASIEPVFSSSDDNNVFKAAKVSPNSVGALTFIIDNKRLVIDYLQNHLLIENKLEEVKELNDLLEETEFVLDCFTVNSSYSENERFKLQ